MLTLALLIPRPAPGALPCFYIACGLILTVDQLESMPICSHAYPIIPFLALTFLPYLPRRNWDPPFTPFILVSTCCCCRRLCSTTYTIFTYRAPPALLHSFPFLLLFFVFIRFLFVFVFSASYIPLLLCTSYHPSVRCLLCLFWTFFVMLYCRFFVFFSSCSTCMLSNTSSSRYPCMLWLLSLLSAIILLSRSDCTYCTLLWTINCCLSAVLLNLLIKCFLISQVWLRHIYRI